MRRFGHARRPRGTVAKTSFAGLAPRRNARPRALLPCLRIDGTRWAVGIFIAVWLLLSASLLLVRRKRVGDTTAADSARVLVRPDECWCGVARLDSVSTPRSPYGAISTVTFCWLWGLHCSRSECARGDLNPRPCGHWHLKPARLPFRHSRSGRSQIANQPGKAARLNRYLGAGFVRMPTVPAQFPARPALLRSADTI